jgi:uncharacterized membrane protein
MAKVPSLPSNGQPIDTQYLYDIVSSLISINSELATYGKSNIKVGNSKYGARNTNSMDFDAQTVNVVNSENVTATVAKTGQIPFTTLFTRTPVVTATLVSKSTTKIKATVTITAVDTTSVYYKIDFDSAGKTTLDLSIIAIGV